jgi:hypothetical protein
MSRESHAPLSSSSSIGPSEVTGMVTHRTSHFFIPARFAVCRSCLNRAPQKYLYARPLSRRQFQFPLAHELTSSSWMAPSPGATNHQETVHRPHSPRVCSSVLCATTLLALADVGLRVAPCRYYIGTRAIEPHLSHHVCSGRAAVSVRGRGHDLL